MSVQGVGPAYATSPALAIGTITTVAGNGDQACSGFGGTAISAHLLYPQYLAVDAAGDLYIAACTWILKVDPGGTITTVAGNGTFGDSGDGGPATSAQVVPFGVAVDGGGNLYFSHAGETVGNVIRKVDTSGTISRVAGNGTAGYSGDGGPATAAQLRNPGAVAADRIGNLYIADSSNNRIRKVDAGGIITTVAGNGTPGYSGDGGPATAAQLNFPWALAVDSANDLYIVDDNRIRKVDASGIITTVAGNGTPGYSGDGGPATAAQLNFATGVAADSTGNLYIGDCNNNRVRKVNAAGIITTVAGNGTAGYSGDGGPATSAQLKCSYTTTGPGGQATPTQGTLGVAVDSAGNLYIADRDNDRVRKVTLALTATSPASPNPKPIAVCIDYQGGSPYIDSRPSADYCYQSSLAHGYNPVLLRQPTAQQVLDVTGNAAIIFLAGHAELCSDDTSSFVDPTYGRATAGALPLWPDASKPDYQVLIGADITSHCARQYQQIYGELFHPGRLHGHPVVILLACLSGLDTDQNASLAAQAMAAGASAAIGWTTEVQFTGTLGLHGTYGPYRDGADVWAHAFWDTWAQGWQLYIAALAANDRTREYSTSNTWGVTNWEFAIGSNQNVILNGSTP